MESIPASRPSKLGCASLLGTTLATCLLLGVNGWIAYTLISNLQGFSPEIIGRPKVAQVAVFILPVLFTVAEWWVLDRLRDLWSGGRRRHSHRRRYD